MYRTILTAGELSPHLDDPAWRLLDCRFRLGDADAGRALYEDAHIPGALYADLERDLSSAPGGDGGRHPLPDIGTMRATFGRWGITPATQVVAYDDVGGQFAARLWWMLRYLGHDAVAVLDGGWQRWLTLGLPTESGDVAEPEAVHFAGVPRPEMLASFDDVASGTALLVDARAPERYRGEVEPLDPVAGHIPGARNRPSAQNLTGEMRFAPDDALREAWEEVLVGRDASEVIVYCGSGVTACHNILAMEQAGLYGARLFPPSWSGWVADPTRPVARGETEG